MKKILMMLCIFTINVYASEMIETTEPFDMSKFVGPGLSMVPLSVAKANLPEELNQEKEKMQLQQKEKGYYQAENKYAKFLLNLQKTSQAEIKTYRLFKNPFDTHLKKNISDIQLAFPFKKLPIDDKDILGYAAIGSYVKSPEGWNGVKVFFQDKDLGVCSYEFTDLNLSHGGVQLVEEETKYIVNKKPSSTVVQGDNKTGFTYSVIWYDNIKVNSLDCAKAKFEKDFINRVISFANVIDKR